ncbi:MAG TPA: hypothetical protein DDY14_07955 [Chromatiaceae bacterium]|nr:MAG: hypothetical protein N838_02165 [Thiohalocapsa sp. PB-PSB1]QQO53343.1 MAG: hypothetical protein N838_08155 [Thiohalocapsa sp. PB-PSB1]HBG95247.1 hypothetical protein [Chromatiaceae bacterium]HCS92423.1 hypothetical protein [Chromatiaceae bacterium]
MTSEQLLDGVKELLPPHRDRVFPPTETLSMFLVQVLSADGSCQQAVDEAVIKRIIGGLPRCEHECVLPGARTLADRGGINVGAAGAAHDRRRRAELVALLESPGTLGRWHNHDHGGHGAESGRRLGFRDAIWNICKVSHELTQRGLSFERQVPVPIEY